MQKLPAAALNKRPGRPTGNLLGPHLRVGCHLPLDVLFGCSLAGTVKVTVGPLPDINRHSHSAFFLHQSMLQAAAGICSCAELCIHSSHQNLCLSRTFNPRHLSLHYTLVWGGD